MSKNLVDIIKIDLESDFVDEDELLDIALPVVYPTDKRSEPGTCPPKGCTNCTCGKDTNNDDKSKEVISACGNCYLGDGFRCGSCPHKGKPPFEPGQKVMIKDKYISESYIKYRTACLTETHYNL